MNGKLITKLENDIIIELNDDNSKRFEMLEDFVLRSNTDQKNFLRITLNNGVKAIKAANYVGIIRLADGCQIEILPRAAGVKKGDIAETRNIMYKMMSAYFSIPYENNESFENAGDSENTFLEFFISVFVRECMKIIKSGLLSGYETVEENSSKVSGTILFAENNRRNLVHRERLYVRHDEFTPDRVENRLLKSAADIMSRLSGSNRNTQNLKKILAILDDVKFSDNYEADFAKCVNTRNSKKYNTALNICRLFLKNKKRSEYSGKYVTYALLFSMDDVFRAYTAKLVKAEKIGKNVRTLVAGRYLCDDQQCFGLYPDIVVCDELNHAELILSTRWKFIETAGDIDPRDMYTLFTYAKKFRCSRAALILPENEEMAELPNGGIYTVDCQGTINLNVKFIRLTD